MNRSQIFMWLETISVKFLSNKQIKQVEDTEISIRLNISSNLNKNKRISVRIPIVTSMDDTIERIISRHPTLIIASRIFQNVTRTADNQWFNIDYL